MCAGEKYLPLKGFYCHPSSKRTTALRNPRFKLLFCYISPYNECLKKLNEKEALILPSKGCFTKVK
jgi:hypothetical protein